MAAAPVPVPDASRDRQGRAGRLPDLRHEARAGRGGLPGGRGDGDAGGPAGLAPVTIDAAKSQLLGLKTVAVTRAPFETSIRTTGRVASDERRVHHVHTRYEGFVEHVTADFTGKFVKKGEVARAHLQPGALCDPAGVPPRAQGVPLARTVEVPSVAQGGRDLLAAARQRLLLWEITPADIERIEKNGEPIRAMPVYAPISGSSRGAPPITA